MDLYEIIKKVANDLFDKVKEKLNVEQNIILAFDEGLGTRIESSDKGLTLYIGLPQTVSIIYGMNQLSEADSHKEYCKTLETPSLLSRDSVKNIDVNLIRVVLLEHILHEMGHACYQHHKKE